MLGFSLKPKDGSGMRKRRHQQSFTRNHSLSIVCSVILLTWIVLYTRSNPNTHWGSFFGNAIADWTGVLVAVIATKYLYEKGSQESKRPPEGPLAPARRLLQQHSLSVFLVCTGIGWILLFSRMPAESKWGQVVGNIISEWTQQFGMVILTKKLIERHSAASAKS
jgi:hypothetical protein